VPATETGGLGSEPGLLASPSHLHCARGRARCERTGSRCGADRSPGRGDHDARRVAHLLELLAAIPADERMIHTHSRGWTRRSL